MRVPRAYSPNADIYYRPSNKMHNYLAIYRRIERRQEKKKNGMEWKMEELQILSIIYMYIYFTGCVRLNGSSRFRSDRESPSISIQHATDVHTFEHFKIHNSKSSSRGDADLYCIRNQRLAISHKGQ